ncbi:hypothetical protein GGX14DRAFT_465418, partial [Mycena pura]
MEVRCRRTLLTFAGLLFASIGFTLSVLSTLFRLLLPRYPTRGAAASATIRRPVKRRRVHPKRRRRGATPLTRTHLSISSKGSTLSSQASCVPSSRRHSNTSELTARGRSAERTIRVASVHSWAGSEDTPDFQETVQDPHRRRRSESTPPSPSPWAFSLETAAEVARAGGPVRAAEVHTWEGSASTRTLDPSPAPSMDSSLVSIDVHHATKGTGFSFLHRKKLHKAPSAPSGFRSSTKKSNPPPPVPPLPPQKKLHKAPSVPGGFFSSTKKSYPLSLVPPLPPDIQKHKSYHFTPLLRRRRTTHETDAMRRWSGTSMSSSTEEDNDYGASSPDDLHPSPDGSGRLSQDTVRSSNESHGRLPVPKRSQTLRTQPYEAPYFFPVPGSVAAEEYMLSRPRPLRSGPGTLPEWPRTG